MNPHARARVYNYEYACANVHVFACVSFTFTTLLNDVAVNNEIHGQMSIRRFNVYDATGW